MKLNFKRLDLQLAHTWTLARGAGTNVSKGVVVELTGADGTVGLGEAAPTARYKESVDTVQEALLLPFQFKAHRNRKPTHAQLIEVLQRLQLPAALLRQESSRISGGEKQRIALARGLLLGKKLYLLDEVTSALDAESKQAVFEVFSDPQLTVLSVAHDPEWLARCTVIFELDAGRLAQVTRHANT